ncbi:hypothetical protein RJ55_06056 [Drechmeria coniospora]|nr:hypothetical protein RJ55_06056 [Drechmeria coniospora]
MPASEGTDLDAEIAELESQAEALRQEIRVQCSTILSSTTTQSLLQASSPASSFASPYPPSSIARRARRADPSRSNLASHATQQRAYTQQCIYRTAAPVTAFKVHDPDPNAVDGGHVLGLRLEVMSRGHFLRPYYVMLNRPFSSGKHLRVHRHTVPPAVPLAAFAARHLPPPTSDANDQSSPPRQDLDRFVRALRREVTRYHNRLGVSADLRRRLGLRDGPESRPRHSSSIVDVSVADIEAKQIKLTWADERSGRLIMDDDGHIMKLVVFGRDGRDWETTKELVFGKRNRMEDIAQRLEDRGAA